jgi:hypothetical protein
LALNQELFATVTDTRDAISLVAQDGTTFGLSLGEARALYDELWKVDAIRGAISAASKLMHAMRSRDAWEYLDAAETIAVREARGNLSRKSAAGGSLELEAPTMAKLISH